MPITEVTRRAIFDVLTLEGTHWAGRLEEVAFLSRLYPLTEMPSTDRRFPHADGDIWQHRVNNPQDWDDDWVFYDTRFQLVSGPDEVLLRFLAETAHPVVRPNADETEVLVDRYNTHLRADGYELHPVSEISGRPIYGARNTSEVPAAVTTYGPPPT